MPTQSEVRQQITGYIAELVSTGLIVNRAFVTTQFLSQLDGVDGDDSDFYVSCGADFIDKAAKEAIGKYSPKDTGTQESLLLDGFDHLQKAYPVRRDGDLFLVPVNLLTDLEIEDRAAEYEKMAAGCIGHARELRDYARRREMAA